MSVSTLTFDQLRLMAKDDKAFQKRRNTRFTKDAFYSVSGIVVTLFILIIFVYFTSTSTKGTNTEEGDEIEVHLEHLNSIVDPQNQIDAEDA